MPMDFPSSPTVGQQYNGYVWTGTAWDSTSAQPIAITNVPSGQNYIINGAFEILQRGVSFTNIASETYHADRWKQNGDGSGFTKIWTSEVFSPGTAPATSVPGTVYMRFNQTVAGTGATYNNPFKQPIESVRTLEGQTVTVSFWAKADSARTITPNFQQAFGSGGSSSVFATGTSITLTTSWTRYTQTFSIPSISGKTIGANSFLELYFTVANNTVQTIDMWGVQVEAGSAATAFRRNGSSIAEELAACQRYAYAVGNGVNGAVIASLGYGMSTTAAAYVVQFPTTMRKVPAFSSAPGGAYVSYGITGANGTVTGFNMNKTSTDLTRLDVSGTGYVAGAAYHLQTNTATSYLFFDAEL